MNRRDSFKVMMVLAFALTNTIIYQLPLGLAETQGAFEAPVRKEGESSRKILIDLQPSEVCNFGDLDLVLNELRASNGKLRLQLSVEELGKKEGVVVFGKPLEKKFEGTNMGTYEVRLPPASDAKVYGVFLCSTSPEELSKVPCSTKRLRPFDQMFKPYNLNMTPIRAGKGESAPYNPPAEVEAKIYFTQYLVDNRKSIFALKDSSSKEGSQILQGLGISRATSTRIITIIDTFSDALGSLPLGLNGDRLQIVLPFFSDKKCNG